ncbi:hypothetical protein CKO35_00975 [Ectothiorhodospira shaposhnikovii]|nr:hypothetical protein [Ectothiorhodospira shaposhnikovii]
MINILINAFHEKTPMTLKLPAAVSTLLCMTASLAAQAEGNVTQVDMQPISIEGSHIDNTQIIPTEQMTRNLAASVADVFRDQSAITIGGGSHNAQRLYLRGIDASNLNITIDGAIQGRSLFQHHGGIGSLDPYLLKRVEVLAGPGADRGAGALGGAIRFETVDAQDLLSPDQQSGATIRAGYYTADRSDHGAATAYTRLGSHSGLMAHIKGVNREDYETGGGDRVHGSAGRDRHYFIKFSLLENEGHSLRLSAERSRNSGLYRWAAGDGAYDPDAPLEYQINDRDTYIVNYRYHALHTPLVNLSLNLFNNENTLNNQTRNNETTSTGKGFELRNNAVIDWISSTHNLVTGIDYYTEDGEIYNNGERQGHRNNLNNLGLFIQDHVYIGRLTLSGGARFDRYETDYGRIAISGNEISPNAGIEVNIGKGWSTFANYGEAVRSTGVIPIGWLASAVDTPTFNAQTGKRSFGRSFRPESSQQKEAGFRYQARGLFHDADRFDASLTYFHNDIDNLIVQIGGSRGQPVTGFYNDDRVTSKGWEARTSWQSGRYQTTLSYLHAKTVDQNGDRITTIRRVGSNTGDRLVWDHVWRIEKNMTMGYTLVAQAGLEDGEIDRSGHTLHHVQAQWQPARIPALSLSLAVRNLFDRRYSEQTTIGDDGATLEPGRDIRMMARYQF